MVGRFLPVLALVLALVAVGCSNKHVQNPIADLGSKQPDKVLYDRAMEALKKNKFDVARMTLQTLINTYPDSEYIARAKLSIGDSWYAEGSSAALAQAENEYKDFKTFFPNMAEAAEAQLKVANIHYRQMEKPDRDFTHAKRAEDEYRAMMLEFPDHPLIPMAKQRLLQVQEVLAEREYRIGRFYFMREAWAAAIARLKSLVDTYPLYSQADDALYMLGNAYESQITLVRSTRMPEVAKGKVIKEFTDKAAEAYSRLLTRYPVMPRAADAEARLKELNRPVPKASQDMIAQNKSEMESRSQAGMMKKVLQNFSKRPDTRMAAKVGEPTLADPKPTNAPDVLKETGRLIDGVRGDGSSQLSVETVGAGAPPPNQPTPRSDSPEAAAPAGTTAPADNSQSAPATTGGEPAGGNNTGIEELKIEPDGGTTGNPAPMGQTPPAATAPEQHSTATSATESVAGDAAQQPPAQTNQVDVGGQATPTPAPDDKNTSSSKKKKKKRFGVF